MKFMNIGSRSSSKSVQSRTTSFSLVTFLLLVLLQNFVCNALSACQDDGFYPHPSDCTKFFRCHAGRKFDFDCGPGTHYNPLLLVCDWPANAGCKADDGHGQGQNRPSYPEVPSESSVEYESPSEPSVTEEPYYQQPGDYMQKYRQPNGYRQANHYVQQPNQAQGPSQRSGHIQQQSGSESNYPGGGGAFVRPSQQQYQNKGPNQFQNLPEYKNQRSNLEINYPEGGAPIRLNQQQYGNKVSNQFQSQPEINPYEYRQEVPETNYHADGTYVRPSQQQYRNKGPSQFQLQTQYEQQRSNSEINYPAGGAPVQPNQQQYGNKASKQFQPQPQVNPYEYRQKVPEESNYYPVRPNQQQYGNRASSQFQPRSRQESQYEQQPEQEEEEEDEAFKPENRYSNPNSNSLLSQRRGPVKPSPTTISNEKFQRLRQQGPSTKNDTTPIGPRKNHSQPTYISSYVEYDEDKREQKNNDSTTTKPMESSYIVYEQETETEGNSKVDESKNDESTKYDSLRKLPTCSFVQDLNDIDESDTEEQNSNVNHKLCTSSNFDWLEIADTEIVPAQKPRKEIQFLENGNEINESLIQTEDDRKIAQKLQKSKISQKCHQLCLMMSVPVSVSGNDFEAQFEMDGEDDTSGAENSKNREYIACVAYSYSNEVCRLYDQIELEPDWIQIVMEPSEDKLPQTLQSKKGHSTRISVPKSQLIFKSWLVNPAIPEEIYRQPKSLPSNRKQNQKLLSPMENHRRIRLPRTSNKFLNCFNACLEAVGCQRFSYDSNNGDCYLRTNSTETSKETLPDNKSKNQFYRSGMISGSNIDDLIESSDDNQTSVENPPPNESLKYDSHFYSEENPIILQLMERLLLKYSDDYVSDSNRYLKPFVTISNVPDRKECQKRCYDSWTSKDRESDDEKNPEDEKRCKFVAIQEDLLRNSQISEDGDEQQPEKDSNNQRKTYSCLMFSEDALDVELKLLQNEDESTQIKDLTSLNRPQSLTNQFRSNNLLSPFIRAASDTIDQMNQEQNTKKKKRGTTLPAFQVKAYVFDDQPAIRFFQIEDPETIRTVQNNQKPFMEWRDVLNDQICFQDCLQTLNSLPGHSLGTNNPDTNEHENNRKCRFLVIRPQFTDSFEDNGLSSISVKFNCSFYDHDPRQASASSGSESDSRTNSPNSSSSESSSTQKYIIHSHPLRIPASHSIAKNYFRTILDESSDQTLANLESKQFHRIDLIQDINYCLHYCLKMWILPNSSKFIDSKCHKVETFQVVQDDLVRFNCTFSEYVSPAAISTSTATTTTSSLDNNLDNLNNSQNSSNQHLMTAFESSEIEEIGFQLERLRPLDPINASSNKESSDPLSGIDQHFRGIQLDSDAAKLIPTIKPSIVVDQQPDYRKCLKLCLDFWARIKLGGDDLRERCRLVVVRRSTGKIDQFRKLVSTVPLYECRFYDLEIEKKQNSSKQHRRMKTYRRITGARDPINSNLDKFEKLSDETVVAWDAFYHYSRATSATECLELCRTREPTLYQFKHNRCNVLIAEPIVGYDEVLGRKQIEYECSFYEKYSNLTEDDLRLNRLMHQIIPEIETIEQRLNTITDWAYQLIRLDQYLGQNGDETSNQDPVQYYDEIEYDSEPVRYADQLFEPIFVATVNRTTPSTENGPYYSAVYGERLMPNESEQDSEEKLDQLAIGQCLQECLQFNKEGSKTKLALGPGKSNKHLHCQLVTISPGRVVQNKAVNFNCKFYNFNATEYRFTDLDNPEPIQAYKLSWKENPLVTFEFMIRSKHDQLFKPINNNRTTSGKTILSEIVGKRRAFLHLTKVSDLNECYSQCLNTWMMRFLYSGQPQLCRLITVRSYVEMNSPGFGSFSGHVKGMKYDCSFYEFNITNSLQSLQVMVREPKLRHKKLRKINQDQDREAHDVQLIPTEDGSLYKQIRWPLTAPYETDQTKVLDRPAGIQHCIKECDQRSSNDCRAILLQNVRNHLVRCYFIGSNEYLPDRSNATVLPALTTPILVPSHNSQLLVKLSNIDYDYRSHRPLVNEYLEAALKSSSETYDKQSSPNPYLTMIDAIRNYELNQPMVDKLTDRVHL